MRVFVYELTAGEDQKPSQIMGPQDDNATADERGKRRVLIVEDDYFIALTIEAALTSAGYDIIDIASNMQDALAAAERERPDFVFMDIRLRGGDSGITTAIQLFEHYGLRSIFVTAHSDAETKAQASKARPLGWVVKPFMPADLINALSNAAAAQS